MTCKAPLSDFMGTKEIHGVEHIGARCPKCFDEVWFPTYSANRCNEPAEGQSPTEEPVVG